MRKWLERKTDTYVEIETDLHMFGAPSECYELAFKGENRRIRTAFVQLDLTFEDFEEVMNEWITKEGENDPNLPPLCPPFAFETLCMASAAWHNKWGMEIPWHEAVIEAHEATGVKFIEYCLLDDDGNIIQLPKRRFCMNTLLENN
jgi:hypothetical protein